MLDVLLAKRLLAAVVTLQRAVRLLHLACSACAAKRAQQLLTLR
jgi:hypothetical protein